RLAACAPQILVAARTRITIAIRSPFLSPERTDPGDVATNGESVDIMGAFVGGDRLEVHQMPDHRITISDAHGAEEVARFTRTFQRHPDVVALRQRDLFRPDRARFHHAGET